METLKKFLIFQGTKLSYISGNTNPKKLFTFQELSFVAQKMKKPTLKKCPTFKEMELSYF